MAALRIVPDDLSGPQIARFLAEHVAQMLAVSPPESKHALDLDALRRPEITFWSVFQPGSPVQAPGSSIADAGPPGGILVGCGAIKRLDAAHAEVKSMRVTPARRHSGIGSALLAHIVAEAARMQFTRLSLETGSASFFEPARRLYQKFGFTYCEPFAGYRPDPASVFMTRRL